MTWFRAVVVCINIGILAGLAVFAREVAPAAAQVEVVAPSRGILPAEEPTRPLTPADLAAALKARDWSRAEDLVEALGPDLDDTELVRARDHLRRGMARDRDFQVETDQTYRLAAWRGESSWTIGTVQQRRRLNIRRDQQAYPLIVHWPRERDLRDAEAWFADWTVLDIRGMEITSDEKPTGEDLRILDGRPIRILCGNGLGALEPGTLASLKDLEELDLSAVPRAAQLAPLLAALEGSTILRRLRLSGAAQLSAEDVGIIASLTGLEYLTFGCQTSAAGLDIGRLGALVRLKEAVLSLRDLPDEALVAIARGCRALERLDLHVEAATPLGVAALADLDGLTRLRLAPADPATVAALAGCSRVEQLTLALTLDPDRAGGVRSLAPLGEMAVLKEWNLTCTGPGGAVFADLLAGIDGMVSLRRLHLGGTAINDALLAACPPLTGVEHLRLQGVDVGDAALVRLADALDVQDLVVTSAPRLDGSALAGLCAIPTLRSLTFDRVAVTEANFLKLANPGALERLDIRNTPVFTAASVDRVASWTRRPRVSLDEKLLDDATRKRLRELSDSAIPGLGYATAEANDF